MIYKHFKSRSEIEELIKIEPDWELLTKQDVIQDLFQLSKHVDLLQEIRPKSIEELADCMALIRPGKRGLLGLYKKHRDDVRPLLYVKDKTGYSFKKSHALAYSYVVILQLHLLKSK